MNVHSAKYPISSQFDKAINKSKSAGLFFGPRDQYKNNQADMIDGPAKRPTNIDSKAAGYHASNVMRKPISAQSSFFKPPTSIILRKCVHCEAEEQSILRKEAPGDALLAPSTTGYLNSLSGGSSLGKSEQSFFKARMGYDFSNVRIHNNSDAHTSAQNVNALAYTHGNNVVFAPGQYRPETEDGKRLLAHELTHVVQQSGSLQPSLIQRQSSPPGTCDSSNLGTLGPMFTKDEASVQQMKLPPRQLVLSTAVVDKEFVLFCPHKASTPLKRLVPGSTVYYIGSGKVRGKDEVWAKVEGESNYYWGFIKNSYYEPAKKEEPKKEEPKKEAAPEDPAKKGVCGPDVTMQVENGLRDLKAAFKSKTPDEKHELCQELTDPIQGFVAWDFLRLHVRDWLRNFRPNCASVVNSANEACCANSVEVNDECYYGGSVNYVQFGAICKLCHTLYRTTDYDHLAQNYTSDEMTGLITKYKKEAANYKQSIDWSLAGYDNWPAGGSPPKGDCTADCHTECPIEFASFGTSDAKSFRARWCPHIDPVGSCQGWAGNLWDYARGAKQ